MLTPEELRDLPEEVAEIFEECEDVILRLIAERINAVGYINTVSVWQLIKRKESLLLRKDVAKELARYTGRSEKEIRKIFKKAGAASLLHDDSFLKANTLNKKRKRLRPLDRILKKAYDQTKGTFRNWTGTTASNVSNRFVRAMDKAALQVQSGAFSYDEAIRLATRDLADHMDYVQYPSGHRDTLEVASRRAVRTGVNQMSSKLTLQRCKELGIEFVETTAHAGARVSKSLDCRNHSWWQGKVFHLSKEGAKGEDDKFYPGFYSFEHAGYGYGEGICGWNCRHSFHPFIPGISEQVYTPEQLDKLNEKKFTYEGKQYSRYEADQYQRGLERNIRKYKRRAVLSEGIGDQKETERNQSYIRKWSNELDKFTRATGLKRDYERERETVGNDANSNENERGIANDSVRAMANGPRRAPSRILNEEEIEEILKYADELNIPHEVLIFNKGNKTGFVDDNLTINIRGDIFPAEYADNPDSILSAKAALAHEYYGHYMHYPSRFEIGDWRDEFEASYSAALNAPNLSDDERRLLMIDAFERAQNAGVSVKYNKKAREIIYGY